MKCCFAGVLRFSRSWILGVWCGIGGLLLVCCDSEWQWCGALVSWGNVLSSGVVLVMFVLVV